MITCHLLGGLGNQLFQIFTTIAYSIQSKQSFGFLNSYSVDGCTERHTYWNTFLLNLKMFTYDKLNEEFEIIGEKNFRYSKLPINNSEGNDCEEKSKKLIGYFQSYRYFEYYFDNICSIMSLSYLKKQMTNEYSQYFSGENLISMHFRLGDYKKLPDYHPILPVEYYIESLKKIFEILKKRKDIDNKKTCTPLKISNGILSRIPLDVKGKPLPVNQLKETSALKETSPLKESSVSNVKLYNILYFCEKEDNEDVELKIEVLKKEFPTIEFIKADDSIEDWKQMILMSCCKHNIIANSSFSWWGGHFNLDKEKIVCYPKIWFGSKLTHHVLHDLFPPSWNKIDF